MGLDDESNVQGGVTDSLTRGKLVDLMKLREGKPEYERFKSAESMVSNLKFQSKVWIKY